MDKAEKDEILINKAISSFKAVNEFNCQEYEEEIKLLKAKNKELEEKVVKLIDNLQNI